MSPIAALFSVLGLLTAGFVADGARSIRSAVRTPDAGPPEAAALRMPNAWELGVGAVTNFFDTLGIGSFAPTTALFRLKKLVPDELIPGTLNVGHSLPVIVQAFIYIAIIEIDVVTLVAMCSSAVLGAWIGAGIVSHWPRRVIQIGMGIALLAAAAFMFMAQLELFPAGGDALGVSGARLVVAVAGNFVLGALMTLGIGLYAPSMILISLLGMSPKTAFPVMMGSCAFLMPVGSLRFMRERKFSLPASLGLTLGGVPAVLLAAYIVRELPLYAVRWLVIVAVTYTAVTLLQAARKGR